MMIKQKIKTCWQYGRKAYFCLPAVVLLFWVYYPFAANIFNSNTELLDNRPLKHKPTKLTSRFAQEFTDYYNDTFAGRKKLIVKYVKLKQKLKIDTGQYFHGKKGWMFYDSAKVNNGNSMLDYYAEVMPTDAELEQMRNGLELEKQFFQNYGAKYLLLTAPNKENIYSEYMPDRMQKKRVSAYSFSDAGTDYLNENGIDALNLKSVLLAAKQEIPYGLYYKKDTHWNAVGGYVGFYALMQKLKDFGVGGLVQPLTTAMISEAGLVVQDMHPTDGDMSYTVHYLDDKTFTRTEVQPNMVILYENINPVSDETIMVKGDSFARALLPYLAKNYRRVVNIATGVKNLQFYKNVMEEYKPDVVVREVVERYFRRLVNSGKLYRQD